MSKELEGELLEKEGLLRTAFEFGTIGIAIISPEKGFLRVNDEICRMMGYSREELMRMTWAQTTHPDDLQSNVTQVSRVLAGEIDGFSLDKRYIRKDGTVVYATVWINCKRGDDGKVKYFIAMLHDITERKKLEYSLVVEIASRRETENRLNRLLEASFEGIVIAEEGRIIDANKRYAEMFGYEPGEMFGMSVFDLVAPQYREIAMKHVSARYEEPYEADGLKKDGTIIRVEVCGKNMEYEGRKVRMSALRDITEKKAREEQLRQSEERFRMIAENITEVFWMADVAISKVFYVSPGYERIWGRPMSSVYENPRSFIDSIHEDDRQRALTTFEIEKIGQPFDHEYRIIRPDGTIRWIWERGFPVADKTGRVTRYAGVSTDITEKKRMNDELKESEQRFKALFDGVPDAIFLADPETGYIIDANLSASKLLDRPVSEIRGMHHTELHPKETEQYSKEAFREHADESRQKSQIHPIENYVVRSDGRHIPVEVNAQIIYIKGKRILQGVFRDITDRKNAEQEWEYTFNSMSDLIMIVDINQKFIKVNKAFASKMGKTQEEMVGLACYESVHGLSEPPPYCPQSKLLVDGKSYEYEIFEERLGGYYLVSVTPLRDSDSDIVGSVIAAKDITKRKSLEEELQKSTQQSESMMRDMSMLLKEIHHRVKNNLQIISSLLSLQADRISDANFQNIFKDSQNRIKAMALVHEKLYRSSNLTEFDVKEYIQDLSSELFYTYNAYPDAIDLRFDIGIVSIDVDLIITCGLVINELLSNALKYAFPGGKKGRITISFNRALNDKYLLIVSDDGVGIPEQWDIETTDSLGLQLVNDLITRKLKGKIDLDRTIGTKFTMVF
ncbi:MAG: PAS domain S-box protein [Nitrospirae bacterium]|nr:PAS domain S-box protein [Nitrospirota bacterium]